MRRRGAKLFRNQYPDVYSGFVIAHAAGTYLASEAPMTVAGTSGGSYGVATLFHRGWLFTSPSVSGALSNVCPIQTSSSLSNSNWLAPTRAAGA